MKRTNFIALISYIFLTCTSLFAGVTSWPINFSDNGIAISIYSPNLEKINGSNIEFRSVVSVNFDEKNMLAGVAWLNAEVSLNNNEAVFNNTTLNSFKISSTNDIEKVKTVISAALKSNLIVMTKAEFSDWSNLSESNLDFKNEPPIIKFMTNSAVCVMIEGEPKWKLDNKVGKLLNSPYVVLSYDNDPLTYFLRAGKIWFTSDKLFDGNWQVVQNIPEVVLNAVTNLEQSEIEKDFNDIYTNELPQIIVSTNIIELFCTSGAPDWNLIKNSDLMYIKNTNRDVFKDPATQKIYVLISGRWFCSDAIDGTWVYVKPSDLPKIFSTILDDENIFGRSDGFT